MLEPFLCIFLSSMEHRKVMNLIIGLIESKKEMKTVWEALLCAHGMGT